MAPRSLADDLRERDDEALAALLRARPDLVSPVPSDITALAARAASRPSALRALDRLDLFHLQVVDVLAALPEPTTAQDVDRLLGADASAPLAKLRELALVWGPDDGLRLVRAVRDAVPNPGGLGPPAEDVLATYSPSRLAQLVADLELPPTGDPATAVASIIAVLRDPEAIERLLAETAPSARELAEKLAEGPPTGRVAQAERRVTRSGANSAVEQLLARALLLVVGPDTVVLPREVGLHLRGDRVHRAPAPAPPPAPGRARDLAQVDRTAVSSAFHAVRHIEDLLDAWGVDGPPVLRAGGLGVRELRRTAAVADLDEPVVALLLEIAYAAGLLGRGGEADDVWLPTPAYDVWRAQDFGRRWWTVACAWFETTRVPGLAGARDERDKLLPVLGPDLDRAPAPEIRRAALAELADLPAGTTAGPQDVIDRLRWRRPRRGGRLRDDLVAWTLREAEVLGVTGLGALSGPGRCLLSGDSDGAVAALTPLLPEPLEHVLLQADLTAVAPGPLTTELAHELALVADVESRGGATVYRFSERSVRRGLDAGRSADEIKSTLAAHSRTPVPQPLDYLVDDVARRHGRIRVGVASAYVRCDDVGLLSEILADRRVASLRLRRLAPTVLAAQSSVETVLERLREVGHAPAAESPDGDVVVRRPDSSRTPPRQRPPRVTAEPPVPGGPLVAAAVRALRAGDRAAASRAPSDDGRGAPLPRTSPADALIALRAAARGGTPLWIGYVNAEGHATQRVIEPVTVEGGYVSAFDHLRDEVRTFALHRITGVAPVDAATR